MGRRFRRVGLDGALEAARRSRETVETKHSGAACERVRGIGQSASGASKGALPPQRAQQVLAPLGDGFKIGDDCLWRKQSSITIERFLI